MVPSIKVYGPAALASALALTMTIGCSTKNYVRTQTGPLIQQTNDLDAKTAADHRNIQDTDQRAQAGITKAQSAAEQAEQHAQAAGQSAEQANGSATEAVNRVDTLQGVIIIHTAMVLPFIVIVTAGVFLGVSRELEEAATTLGTSRFGAFVRVALPLALPGLAAAAIFTFVTSWNEVFAATILTLRTRTLPAQVLAGLGTSPLGFKFAGGLFMAMPAVAFIFLIRRYLMNLWGSR